LEITALDPSVKPTTCATTCSARSTATRAGENDKGCRCYGNDGIMRWKVVFELVEWTT
jgi:hypothetical protein